MLVKNEFYPTPQKLLKEIFAGMDWKDIRTVLEPSAGKGDIVQFLMEYGNVSKTGYRYNKNLDIDCIEKDTDLQKVLRGHGYRVVHNDFLTFHTFKEYDLIVMNPPFSNGDKHLLKAIDMQKEGGSIICILNAETIRNPYSLVRKELLQKLETYHADISFLTGAFEQAERKTFVEVAVIKVSIPKKEKTSRIFSELKTAYYMDGIKQEENSLCINDFVKATVKQYELEVDAGIQLIREYQAMAPSLMSSLKENPYAKPLIELKVNGTNNFTINDYVKNVRSKYWNALFQDVRFTGNMTTNLLDSYRKKVDELSEYDFSLYNIYSLQLEMSKNLTEGIEECIIKLFDELSYQYSYSSEYGNNVHYYNGWKTNKCWIINKKVILPFYNAWDYFGNFRPNSYDVMKKLSDIEKALDYLNGIVSNEKVLQDRLQAAERANQTKKIPLRYFTVTFYKKGTCHIEFTDLELLKKLNIYGSQKKGWLPPSYGKKTYESMSLEEQKVVDAFEGKKSYEKVMEHPSYFLLNAQTLIPRIA